MQLLCTEYGKGLQIWLLTLWIPFFPGRLLAQKVLKTWFSSTGVGDHVLPVQQSTWDFLFWDLRTFLWFPFWPHMSLVVVWTVLWCYCKHTFYMCSLLKDPVITNVSLLFLGSQSFNFIPAHGYYKVKFVANLNENRLASCLLWEHSKIRSNTKWHFKGLKYKTWNFLCLLTFSWLDPHTPYPCSSSPSLGSQHWCSIFWMQTLCMN